MRLFCFLLFTAWINPLQLPPWISWHKEVMVYLGLLLWVLSLQRHRKLEAIERDAYLLPRLVLVPFALFFLVIFQYTTGQIALGGDAVVLSLYSLSAALAISLGFRSERQLELVQCIAFTCLVAGALSVGLMLVQSFLFWHEFSFVASLFGPRRPGANLAQPNQLATLLLFSWASLVYLCIKGTIGKVTLIVLTIWIFLGLAATESRTGFLSTILLLGWCFMHRKTVCSKLTIPMLILAVLFYVACFVSWPAILTWYWMEGEASSGSKINLSAGTRLVVWPQLWEAVLLKPWLGWGLLNVTGAHNAVLHNYSFSEAFSYAHNLILDGAVGIGIPLTIVAVVATFAWFVGRLRDTQSQVTWYCIAITLPLGVHSLLEFPFAYSFFLFPVCVLLGVLESRASNVSLFRLPSRIAATLVVGASALGAVVMYEYFLIEEDFRVARFEALRIGSTIEEYRRPNVHLLTQLDVLLEATRLVPQENMSASHIETLRLATMRYPWSAIQNRYALSLALNGNTSEAERQLRVIRAMHGAHHYARIKQNWVELASQKSPVLRDIQLPD